VKFRFVVDLLISVRLQWRLYDVNVVD